MKISTPGWCCITILGLALIIAAVIAYTFEPGSETVMPETHKCIVVTKDIFGGEYTRTIMVDKSRSCSDAVVPDING